MSIGRLILYGKSKAFALREHFHTLLQDPGFLWVEALYLLWGFFMNPYRSCRKKISGVYGETPLSVVRTLAAALSLSEEDSLWELGSGRGKACFYLNRLSQCQVIGVEIHPWFYRGSIFLKHLLRAKKVEFLKKDLFSTDLSSATAVYLYGTGWEVKSLKSLKKGTRVATVSDSLTESLPGEFSLQKTFEAAFPWGITDIYIQTKI